MSEPVEIVKKSLIRKNSSSFFLDYGSLPPYDKEMEVAILGAVLIEADAIQSVIGILTPESFYVDAHQKIWKAIVMLHDNANPIDLLTVTHQLRVNGDLDAAGGPYYIAQLTSGIGSAANITFHARIVQEKRMLRLIIAACTETLIQAYGNAALIDECLTTLESTVENIQAMFNHSAHNAYSATQEALDDIKSRDSGLINSQLYTGWQEYDDLLMLDACKLIIVASGQKIGKTAWVISQIRRLVRKNKNVAVKWYSFEMTAAANIRRIVMEDCHLTENQLLSRKYQLTSEEKKRIKASMEDIAKWDMEIVDRRMGVSELARDYKLFCKKRKGKKQCICVIDNHGFLASKTEEDDLASKEYSYLRDQTNSLVFVIHHLATKGNPFFNIESGYEPSKDMVRGSTRILDYCNALILLHRPNFFSDLMNRLKLECTPNELDAINKLFIGIVPLNRDGETGIFRLQHNIATNTFNEFPKTQNQNDSTI